MRKKGKIGVFFCFLWLCACSDGTLTTTGCSVASFLPSPTSGASVGIGLTSLGGPSVAQAFVAASSASAISAAVLLSRVGTFTLGNQTLTVTIEGNNNGVPNGIPVATSNTIDPSIISMVSTTYTFTFSTPVALTAGTTYWLRVKGSYAVNSTNYINWTGFDGSSGGGYSLGTTKLNAVYEQSTANAFSYANIGSNRYLLFNVGC